MELGGNSMDAFFVDIQVQDPLLTQQLQQWVQDCAELALAVDPDTAQLHLWDFSYYSYRRQLGLILPTGVIVIDHEVSAEREQQVLVSGAQDYLGGQHNVRSTMLRLSLHVQRLQYVEKLENLCVTDTLTGLYNRRKFDQEVDKSWRQSQRQQTPCSLLLVDVDHFKMYNDTYGHIQGDDCLIALGDILKGEAVRARDIAARIGGEEFAILLPDTPKAGAMHVAQNILARVRQANIPNEKTALGYVTLSIGVACVTPSKGDKLQRWVKWADDSLYAAKKQGRDSIATEPLAVI